MIAGVIGRRIVCLCVGLGFVTGVVAACGEDDASAETSPNAELDVIAEEEEATGPRAPLTLSERGFSEVRVVAHLHSAYSHDGCDDAGLDADGRPNLECVRRMKRALCSERIGHTFMTDHPSFLRDQAWEDLFYADEAAGDEVMRDDDGRPWAVRFSCGEGEGGPGGRATLMVGFEGTHTMPLGLRAPIDWARYHAFEDSASPEALAGVTAAVAEAGGVMAIAHSEQSDLSAQTIAQNDVAAMELYNFHANFNEVLGGGLGDALFSLESFLAPDALLPDPDLTALILLGHYPEAALSKWRAVSAVRPITAFAGADAHENVSFAAACKDTDACDGIARLYPNLVEYLKVGGPLWQSDGERLDGYARVFRWVQNRVWVEGAAAADPLAVEAAFSAGRSFVVFEVFGDAREAALVVQRDGGALHDVGETIALEPEMTLWARSPEVPAATPSAGWRDGGEALIESVLWRSDAGGSQEVARWSGPATWHAIEVTEAGAYQLEVLITPRHLAEALGPAAAFADGTYRWVESNAIRIVTN